jgi:hypothetical protein
LSAVFFEMAALSLGIILCGEPIGMIAPQVNSRSTPVLNHRNATADRPRGKASFWSAMSSGSAVLARQPIV